ncbi:MAG: hypothetical protein JSS43_16860 [Proteobacteria bacterium]|nr:hypothetical protein [Pseudomonadota bacterium]
MVVRTIDAATLAAAQAGLPTLPDFDPKTQLICERAVFAELRSNLENALHKLSLREEEVARLRQRNAQLEADYAEERRFHDITLKEKIALQMKIAATTPKQRGRGPKG